MLFRYEDAKQLIIWLWDKNDYIIEGSLLLAKIEPGDRIVFLERTDVILLEVEKLRQLKRHYAQIEQLIESLMAKRLEQVYTELIHHKFISPIERLRYTMEFKKNAFNKLTVMQKASYLGISKQSLYNLLYNSKKDR